MTAADRGRRGLYSLGLADHDQLNRAFGGGLPRGSVVVVEGNYGAGKSTLAGRFAVGLCGQSHRVTYLSTERPVGRFVDAMRSLSYDVTGPLLDRDLLYLFGDLSAVARGDDPPRLLARLTESRRLWDADVVVVDAFCDLMRYDPTFAELVERNDRRRAAQRVVSFLRRVTLDGRTAVLTVDPFGLGEGTLEPFRAVADVLLRLTETASGGKRYRTVEVERFVGMGGSVDDRIGFRIRPGVGIVLDNRRVI